MTAPVERLYDSQLTPDRPVDWWHQLQGGPVAADRPPPPGIDDPYPTFAKIPPRPPAVDLATRHALVARLAAQRDQTARLDQQDPIVWPPPDAGTIPGQGAPLTVPSQTPARAAKPGGPPATANPADASGPAMVLDAATSTPSPGAALPTPPAPTNDPHPPAALVAVQGSEAPVVSGPLPAIPTAAPPLPVLPGLPTSETIPVVARPAPSAQIKFAAGSAALPDGAEAALKALAMRRAGAAIAVVAGGGARSSALAVQQEALPLALRRTGAITAALVAAGVPVGQIRAEAVAQGRDGSARLLN